MDRTEKFLRLVADGYMRKASAQWAAEVRSALSDGLVTVGFGGALQLTDAGRERLKANA
jgi:hypothetical protein